MPNRCDGFRVAIKTSAYEENPRVRRLLEFPDGDLDLERRYESIEAAELDVIRLTHYGRKDLRLQPAEHDANPYQAYIVSTGKSAGGFGRTTRQASSGWEYTRKRVLERDEFVCQTCGVTGGREGEAELHVDHITPRHKGGSDDVTNLRTLCRDCHMDAHDSTRRPDRADLDLVVETVNRLTEQAHIPAFLTNELYDWVSVSIDSRVQSDVFTEGVETLVRFDRFCKTSCTEVRKHVIAGNQSNYTRTHQVIYDATSRVDSDLLSYDYGLHYDGLPIERGDVSTAAGEQRELNEF